MSESWQFFFSLSQPGTETEEGAAGLYRREGKLEADEEVRKGSDDGKENDSETDPEGMSDDDFLGATMEDKETQTENLLLDKKQLKQDLWQARRAGG